MYIKNVERLNLFLRRCIIVLFGIIALLELLSVIKISNLGLIAEYLKQKIVRTSTCMKCCV